MSSFFKRMGKAITDSLIVILITAILGWVGGLVTVPIYNWIQQFGYSGANIEGQWITDFTFEDLIGNEVATLKQHGSKIYGDIYTTTTRADGKKRILQSKLIGEIRDDYLVAYYVPKSSEKIGSGSFTFRLVEGGNRLEGYCPFQYTQDRELKLMQYGWTRAEKVDQ